MDDSSEILQRLHDCKLNASLSWFSTGGFRWAIGNELTRWSSEGTARTAKDAIHELAEAALAEFPESEFGVWWKAQRDAAAGR